MGFLDKAKRLADQARELAEGAGLVEGQRPPAEEPAFDGTPMWARCGWEDPAALLTPADLEPLALAVEPAPFEDGYASGLRWSVPGRSVALGHVVAVDVEPDDQDPRSTFELLRDVSVHVDEVAGVGDEAFTADDHDGRLFVRRGRRALALRVEGLERGWLLALGRTAAGRLPAGPPTVVGAEAVLAHLGLADPRTLLPEGMLAEVLEAVPPEPQLVEGDGVQAMWAVEDRGVVVVAWDVDTEALAAGEEPSSPLERFRLAGTPVADPALGDEARVAPAMVRCRLGEQVLCVTAARGRQPLPEPELLRLAARAVRAARSEGPSA